MRPSDARFKPQRPIRTYFSSPPSGGHVAFVTHVLSMTTLRPANKVRYPLAQVQLELPFRRQPTDAFCTQELLDYKSWMAYSDNGHRLAQLIVRTSVAFFIGSLTRLQPRMICDCGAGLKLHIVWMFLTSLTTSFSTARHSICLLSVMCVCRNSTYSRIGCLVGLEQNVVGSVRKWNSHITVLSWNWQKWRLLRNV